MDNVYLKLVVNRPDPGVVNVSRAFDTGIYVHKVFCSVITNWDRQKHAMFYGTGCVVGDNRNLVPENMNALRINWDNCQIRTIDTLLALCASHFDAIIESLQIKDIATGGFGLYFTDDLGIPGMTYLSTEMLNSFEKIVIVLRRFLLFGPVSEAQDVLKTMLNVQTSGLFPATNMSLSQISLDVVERIRQTQDIPASYTTESVNNSLEGVVAPHTSSVAQEVPQSQSVEYTKIQSIVSSILHIVMKYALYSRSCDYMYCLTEGCASKLDTSDTIKLNKFIDMDQYTSVHGILFHDSVVSPLGYIFDHASRANCTQISEMKDDLEIFRGLLNDLLTEVKYPKIKEFDETLETIIDEKVPSELFGCFSFSVCSLSTIIIAPIALYCILLVAKHGDR